MAKKKRRKKKKLKKKRRKSLKRKKKLKSKKIKIPENKELVFKVPKKWSNNAYVDKKGYEKRSSAIVPKSIPNTTSRAKLTSKSIKKQAPKWYHN